MNRPPYRRSDEITAYTYQADIYCPACLIETLIADGIAAPAARDMPTDDVLEQCADALAINRDDDTTYDTSEFPKPVFLDWLTPGDTCTSCHQPL
ncbi:MAG: hypothetical protein ACE37B_14425 [Ilumatobacter sp.]|uniref:hypothetical protein n=1 Tax=Ilumatobacter sp. TaxID=1967498 RepID=UPI00391B170D